MSAARGPVMRTALFALLRTAAPLLAQADVCDATKALNPCGRGTDYPTSIGLGT